MNPGKQVNIIVTKREYRKVMIDIYTWGKHGVHLGKHGYQVTEKWSELHVLYLDTTETIA